MKGKEVKPLNKKARGSSLSKERDDMRWVPGCALSHPGRYEISKIKSFKE